MTKTEVLLIRACKSEYCFARVRRVYEKQYGKYDDETTYRSLVIILSDIVDTYIPMKLTHVLSKIHCINEREGKLKNIAYVQWLITEIATTSICKFEGYIIPVRFRQLDNEIRVG